MGRHSTDELSRQLVQLVPADGATIGNKRLRELLGWEPEKYQRVKDALVEEEVLQVGRGRGGTVSLTTPSETFEDVGEGEPGPQRREDKLYPNFFKALLKWAVDEGWRDHFVEQIAHQGRRPTGGNWTRPDFVVVGYRKYDFTPGIIRDVETFEVKPIRPKIEAVFETAAHSRCATKSYLCIEKSIDRPRSDEDETTRLESECQRFGLGLILFKDTANPDDWEYLVDPVRREPDPDHLENFMRDQVGSKDKLRQWIR